MLQRGRMAGDRGAPRDGAAGGGLPARWDGVRVSAPMLDALEGLLVLVALGCALFAGWAFAALVDPKGDLLRWTLGWFVGEFR